jgi:hypothetical protein
LVDSAQDNLLKEIQEDLRRDRLNALWKRYGGLLIGVVAAVVVAVAAFQGWRAYDHHRRQAYGERFLAAETKAATDPAAGAQAFSVLAKDASGGYGVLARFQEAALLARQGRTEEAVSAYDVLLGEVDDPLYRDLARLQSVAVQLADARSVADPASLIEVLAPLTDDANPWRYSARELTADLALQAGDRARARDLFSKLEADIETPQGIRARASEMLSRLGQG